MQWLAKYMADDSRADAMGIDGVTIFLSTHLMNEAERCDRISLMHAGRVLDEGAPDALVRQRGVRTLDQAFIACIEEAADRSFVAECRRPHECGLRLEPLRRVRIGTFFQQGLDAFCRTRARAVHQHGFARPGGGVRIGPGTK